MKLPVYLDNHSTTRVDEKVVEEMLPWFSENFGNPSSKTHPYGWAADEAVKNARRKTAEALNADPSEIIFTGSTTEANNIVIQGLAAAYGTSKNHIITVSTEHPSVLDTVKALGRRGFEVTILEVDKTGMVSTDELSSAIKENTLLVTVMAANNEIGTIAPIKEISEICHSRNVLFHTDAAQAIGKMEFDVKELGPDFVSISGHKNHGPKGIGALYIKKRKPQLRLSPIIFGGGQEKDLRPGTLNVPLIAGLGKALEISSGGLQEKIDGMKFLRDFLYNSLTKELTGIHLNGHPVSRLPNNLNISIEGVSADLLMLECRDLAFSTGSACASDDPSHNYVLRACHTDEILFNKTIRIGLSRFTTREEIDFAAARITEAVKKIRTV